MRIAISALEDKGIESAISAHFGRCPYFVLVDLDGQQAIQVQVIANPYYGSHEVGQVPGFIHSHDVDVMLTGGMGRRAIEFFEQYGVKPVTGAGGTAQQALEQYFGGQLAGGAPCNESVEHGHSL